MQPDAGTLGDRPSERSLRASVMRHIPFLAFLGGFGAYCSVLQFWFSSTLSQLFLVRIFFQVALAALVIATMRSALGVRTLGMFAPSIIALAFLATGLPLGLALLGVILLVVVLTRASLIRERIHEAHRIAILVTMVSVVISSIALAALEFQQHQLFFAVLFPVLISGWMGERYVERVNRVGWDEPSKELAWTLVAIVLSFMVMIQDSLVDFIMLNPVTWVLLVLLNWFLGTKIRFRLNERFRFAGIRQFELGDSPLMGDFESNVLTMTVRNREFVDKYNPPVLMARLGKDAAKSLLLPLGVPVARTYMVLKELSGMERFHEWLGQESSFAMKPAFGYGGEGILLVVGRDGSQFKTSFGPMEASQIEAHAFQILDGEFHGGRRDAVVLEELLVQDNRLKDIVPLGLADFRVICFLGFPVMAMMRIPTKRSGGKANIHLGAVAAGIRVSTGTIVHSVWGGLPQPEHPDSGAIILDRKIPLWDEILGVAAEAQRLTGLGFAGVDVVLDAKRGPVVMEVNRRPGLEVQNANAAGLLLRLRIIESTAKAELPLEERVRIVKELDVDNWRMPGGKPAPSEYSEEKVGVDEFFEEGPTGVKA